MREHHLDTQTEETNGDNPITESSLAGVSGLQLKAASRGIPIARSIPAAVSEELHTSKSKAQETEIDDEHTNANETSRCSSGKGKDGESNTYSEEVNAVRGVSTFERQEEAVNEDSQTSG